MTLFIKVEREARVEDTLLHFQTVGVGPEFLTVIEVVELPVDHDILANAVVDADSVEFEFESDQVFEIGTVNYFQDA
jgi:hypothetical protein